MQSKLARLDIQAYIGSTKEICCKRDIVSSILQAMKPTEICENAQLTNAPYRTVLWWMEPLIFVRILTVQTLQHNRYMFIRRRVDLAIA